MPQSQSPSPAFEVLIDRASICRRTAALGQKLSASWGEPAPVLVCVIEGGRTFSRALVAHLPKAEGQALPPTIHEIRAASYGAGTESSGKVDIQGGQQFSVEGRRVVIIEDIVDTGRTIQALDQHFRAQGATAVEVATLLSKPSRRVVDVELHYVGFEIDDHFVIGYGMDYAGKYRELPEVVIYDPAVEAKAHNGGPELSS